MRSTSKKQAVTNEGVDPHLLHRLKHFREVAPVHTLEPFTDYLEWGNPSFKVEGKKLVKAGKVALVVLAGGQGSRLRYDGPKGCYPITLIKRKSLFQFLAEKIQAASLQSERELRVAFMTSPTNRRVTEQFFQTHHFFGLKPDQISFFDQKLWPLLDLEGNVFMESPGQIALGANGNGSVFKSFVESGIWERWQKEGVEMVNVIPVDNPLAAPFDFTLFGAHAASRNDVTAKTTLKEYPEEKVGILARYEGKTVVREYSELSQQEKEAKTEEGKLKYGIANLSLFTFSMPFIERMSRQELPLHRAEKAVKMFKNGESLFPELPNAYKFEEFIFDVLPLAERVQALLCPRSFTYAPLKNLKGADSISTVQKALLAFDRHVYAEVSGREPLPNVRFELAPQFYYPTDDLLNKWRGKEFPNEDYLDG